MTGIVRLGPDDWELHRAIRLEALRTAPDKYSTRHEDMVDQPEAWWREVMGRNRYFYARLGGDVVGLAGLATPTGKAVSGADRGAAFAEALPAGAGMLISVFVSASARGQGLGEKLSSAVIGQARAEGLAKLFLDVAEHNAVARGIYARLGFVLTGKSRPAECIGSTHEELEMALTL
ncbi:GNAT family N-acetyltransferase [Segniliparus rugosus]|uniref:N-acetyltransferase domain-containing protein n=1 Tax=Segniliparus rugosus (strain ATCC BAA-974 / DSM 45345 / CCUG 50838 / CIP 108380 / JCM 13579 / CDC 945) TaxID=679197 RepID=E5XQV2_SEGRC|nr:GNAT family N-acetyltransferase [Segniliparus rugosus]EFV13287.1 hypothetical protein HMPREF9336_01874 [Segniliparus rugosus ATCC BAA-974]